MIIMFMRMGAPQANFLVFECISIENPLFQSIKMLIFPPPTAALTSHGSLWAPYPLQNTPYPPLGPIGPIHHIPLQNPQIHHIPLSRHHIPLQIAVFRPILFFFVEKYALPSLKNTLNRCAFDINVSKISAPSKRSVSVEFNGK